MKISYHAWKNEETVKQHISNTIYKVYKTFNQEYSFDIDKVLNQKDIRKAILIFLFKKEKVVPQSFFDVVTVIKMTEINKKLKS